MLQKTFGIYSEDIKDARLFIEAGETHISFCARTDAGAAVQGFELFRFDAADAKDAHSLMREIKLNSNLLGISFTGFTIIWEHATCVCLPAHLSNSSTDEAYLDVAFGPSNDDDVFRVQVKGIQLLYRINKSWVKALSSYFPNAHTTHKWAYMVQENEIEESGLRIVFYADHYIVLLLKNNALQFVQSFAYQTPEEVLYDLLNIGLQYDVPVQQTPLIVSGTIDLRSQLYDVLYRYFERLEIAEVKQQWFELPGFSEFPLHYFSPFVQF
jgi:hypothetical protein